MTDLFLSVSVEASEKGTEVKWMGDVWAVVLLLAAALAAAAPTSASQEIAPPAPPPSEESNIGDIIVTPPGPTPAPTPAPPRAVQETADLSFELTVEGDPPEDALFYGVYGHDVKKQDLIYLDAAGYLVPLHDFVGGYPAGDGVLNVFTIVDRFEPLGYGTRNIPRPVPPYAEPASVPVQIVQATADYELTSVIKDFGMVKLDGDKTFAASVSFSGDGDGSGNNGGGGSDNNGGGSGSNNNGGSDGGGVITPVGNVFSGLLSGRLPETGGGWMILLIAGAILIVSGWLLVRLARRLAAR